MTHCDLPRPYKHLHLVRKLQQANHVGYRASVQPKTLGGLLLGLACALEV